MEEKQVKVMATVRLCKDKYRHDKQSRHDATRDKQISRISRHKKQFFHKPSDEKHSRKISSYEKLSCHSSHEKYCPGKAMNDRDFEKVWSGRGTACCVSKTEPSWSISVTRVVSVVTLCVVAVSLLLVTIPVAECSEGHNIISAKGGSLPSEVTDSAYSQLEVKTSSHGKHHRRRKRLRPLRHHSHHGDDERDQKFSTIKHGEKFSKMKAITHSRRQADKRNDDSLTDKDAHKAMATDMFSDIFDNSVANGNGAVTEVKIMQEHSEETPKDVLSWKRLPTPSELQNFLDLVRKVMTCRQLPNLSLALVKKGKVVLATNLGHSDPEGHVPVSSSTRFAVGSLTKAFTATVITEVLMNHNISLNTPIAELLPDFRLMDDLRTRSVTLPDLLGHRTGVPGYFHALLVGLPKHVTRKEFVSRLQYLPAAVPFRSQFIYNNYMYTLAAYVAETLTGKSWENLVRDLILEPLGMTSTGFVDKEDNFSDFALPCAMLNGTLKNVSPELLYSVSPCGPAGSIYSTAADMARWLQALLGNGKSPNGRQVLRESTLHETAQPVMPPPGIGDDLTKPQYPVSDVEQSYDLGWITSHYRGYRKVWHSGSIVTYSSRLWLLPGVDAGLFVATSGPQTSQKGHALYAITSLAADLLLGEKPWLNESTICTFPSPWAEKTMPPKDPDFPAKFTPILKEQKRSEPPEKEQNTGNSEKVDLDDLAGVYFHEAFGEIIVERGNSSTNTDITSSSSDVASSFDKTIRINADDFVKTRSDVSMTGSDETRSVVKGNPKRSGKNPSSNSISFSTEMANKTTFLSLKFGRFGKLRLMHSSADDKTWQGRFIGPLWYVTDADESSGPVEVQFMKNGEGSVDRLRYPIDSKYDPIEFRKRFGDGTHLDSYQSSGTKCLTSGLVLALGALFVLW